MQLTDKYIQYRYIFFILVSVVLAPNIAVADIDICATGVIQLPEQEPNRSPPGPNSPVNITADSIESPNEGLLSLQGNVKLFQAGKTLLADKILYIKSSKLFEAHNNVRIYSINGDILTTSYLELYITTGKGHTSPANFRVADRTRTHKNRRLVYVAAYGTAEKVIFIDRHNMQLLSVNYVNCLENKGDILVSARELKLNVDTGEMLAGRVKMRILRPDEAAKLLD